MPLPRWTTRALLLALAAGALTLPAAARADPWYPDDPGRGAGWEALQWHLAGPYGVGAPEAWGHLRAAGRPGGSGVVVAVLDTGVAYRDVEGRRRSPDFRASTFVRGYDLVDDDPYPQDGTHVASTIAEATDNGIGVAGLAYGARIMPVRVLDRYQQGSAERVAQGIRWAADHGADVINVSIDFAYDTPVALVEPLIDAVAHATARGALVVAAAGNEASPGVAWPARAPGALAVGATTEHGCSADYSSYGRGLDLVAPGGGPDAPYDDDARCDPDGPSGGPIVQMTLTSFGALAFGLPDRYEGTSMAAAVASAAAALVIASGTIGAHPTPAAVAARLEGTAVDLGAPGVDRRYGAGLVDAAAATAAVGD